MNCRRCWFVAVGAIVDAADAVVAVEEQQLRRRQLQQRQQRKRPIELD